MENEVQKSDPKNEIMTLLKTGTPQKIVNSPMVAERFIKLYETIHGKKDGIVFYESNKFHFLKILAESTELQKCTNQSIYGVWLDSSVNGLSFDPTYKHLYVVPFNHKVSKKGETDKWEKRATLMIGGPGELVLRQKAGQIKYADNPQLVYRDESFKVITKGGKTEVEHEIVFPRKSDEVIGCYMAITRIDGSIDYKVMSMPEVLKLKQWGRDNANSKAWSNLGLPGMIVAKTIKHAFKTYPKVRTGYFSKMQSDVVDAEVESVTTEGIPERIDYGFVEHEESEPDDKPKKPLKETVKAKEKSTQKIEVKQPEMVENTDNEDESEFDEQEAEETLTDKQKSKSGIVFDDDDDLKM